MTRTLVACAGLALGLAACGGTEIDAAKAEAFVRGNVSGPKPRKVDCPDGVDAKKGATFECKLEYPNGSRASVTVHVEDEEGQISVGPGDFKPEL